MSEEAMATLTARDVRAARRSRTPTTKTTPTAARRKTTNQPRTRLSRSTNSGDLQDGEAVVVGSNVNIASPGDDGHGDDSDRDNNENNRAGGSDAPPRQPPRQPQASRQQPDDEQDSMGWRELLTPNQQRAMMKRLWLQPPVEVERQAGLEGDTWTAEEFYYGATSHLKGDASRWLIPHSEHMHEEDKNLAYVVHQMRKKYGSRDNMFRFQQRLAARVQQSGERLSDFAANLTKLDLTTATQVRTFEPHTLDEAVEFVEDKCGEFGEGFKVTEWWVAKRRYRDDREYGAGDDPQPTKKRTMTADSTDQLDWKKLGLGFGGEDPPSFDVNGKAISGLAQTAKKDPLLLAALKGIVLVTGLGREEAKGASSKPKVVKVREVKKESSANTESATRTSQQQSDARNSSGQGRGGRGGLEHYEPPDNDALAQRKAGSPCACCGKIGLVA
ncbi:unnamed protein product [Phytophthora fragariaefolia]|uniref:Unnamed protein product n=1 Tax=Phytophthora fragariaefolia TaxID=1490495 RepID=A0A9W6TJD9_9STRA|nr:unnamed protein product [Phytophthora fragariaefolia]